jgi:hypothetical protein
MEIQNGNFVVGLGARAVAFAMAVVTTAFIATGTTVVLTASAGSFGTKLATVAAAPLRNLVGL